MHCRKLNLNSQTVLTVSKLRHYSASSNAEHKVTLFALIISGKVSSMARISIWSGPFATGVGINGVVKYGKY